MKPGTRRDFLAQCGAAGAGTLLWPALRTAAAVESEPRMQFPAAARERIAIASYPFRDFIMGRDDRAASGKLELKEFTAHVIAKFNINKIEPWSEHFRSLDPAYLEELRASVAKARGTIVNMAVDGEHSPYAADRLERERAVSFSKQWIDAAAVVGSPSVRTNIPPAKNVVVNLENDNPVSEDPFFLIKVIEKVNSKWLHALPDFANTLAAYDEDYAYRGIDGMFGKAYNISHVKETEVGDGKDKAAHVDLARTFGIVKQHGYKGYFSMEWDSPGDPYAGTAGLIEKTLRYLS